MEPSRKVSKYSPKGTMGEVIKQTEQFRYDMLMEVKHCLGRVEAMIKKCEDMDEFLHEHMTVRMRKIKEKKRKRDKVRKELKKLKKKWKKAKKKSEKKRLKKHLDKQRKRLVKWNKRIKKSEDT